MPENMSKPTKRKITVEPSVNKSKDSQRRPSVFERLGTKATILSSGTNQANNDNFCRHWAQNGNCQYGKNCKYANTHTLISPSKRAAKKEGDNKQKQGHNSSSKINNKDDVNKRLHSTVVVKKTHSPDLNWENWDQTDLEYEDEKVLEKRRQLLQRELELQMKREKEEQQRQKKEKKAKKGISSSSSTSASSSSSTESSSSSDDSSSTSSSTSGDSRKRKGKGKKSKRDSSSSASETDHVSKKKSNRSGKVPVKSTSPSISVKKAAVPRREEPRPSTTKRREPSPRKTAPPPPKIGPAPLPRRRSLTPNGRSSSAHRRRSPTPPHKNKPSTASRSSLGSKQTAVKHNQSPRPNRSLSLDRKDKHNRSVSPRAPGRDRDRDRDREREREREREKEKEREREREKEREKEKEREREKEKEREKEREREKEKEKEREREREREKEKERDKERIRSHSPKLKAKDRLSRSPRRNSRPPKDIRKKDSPDSGNSKDKGYRVSPAKSRGSTGGGRGRDSSHDSKRNVGKTSPRDSDRRDTRDTRDSWGKHSDGSRKDHDRGREKDDDRKKDDRDNRRDVPDRGARDGKDRGSRETTLERGGGSRSLKDDGSSRRDDRKRESQMLPGIVEKTAQDRDYMPKGRDHGDNDRDRDRERDRGRDSRDISRDTRDSRDMRDNRDARDGRGDGSTRDIKDGLDRNVVHDSRSTRESREAAREKEREEALERCRERQREREREKELSKAREYEREIPSLLTMMTHKPITLQQTPSLLPSRGTAKGSGLDRSLDARSDRDRPSERDRDRGLDRVPERDRGLERGSERDRGSDRERGLSRGSDRDRGSNRGLDRDRAHSRDRDRERGVDRLSERDRGLDRSSDRDRPSDRDRGLDRNLGRGAERLDRSSERGLARGSDRTSERGLERSSERVLDRGLDRGQLERGLERGFDRSTDRSYDRGSERSLDRGFDRGIERNSHLDRDRDREGRDSHSERDYPLSSRSRDSDGRRPPPEDKGYDSPFEGRRGREERSRYSDQLDRNRYDDAPSQRDDPRSLVDRRLSVDPRSFSEDRRGRREGRNSMEPIRGARDPWDGHERERDRDPRDREQRDRDRDIHDRDLRDRDRGRGYDREEPRSSASSIKGRDWESREYSENRREWDGRGRRGAPPEWENSHRTEWGEKEVAIPIAHALPHGIPPIEGEWGCFPGPPPGDWTPGDRRGGWVDEWPDRSALGGMVPPISLTGPSPVIAGRPPPRMLPHRDDGTLLLLVKDELTHDESVKKLHEEVKEKELMDVKDDKSILEGLKMDESSLKKLVETPESTPSLKRSRDADSDAEKPEPKKICLDESANLEEDLSDISDDDADEILNREDSVEDLGVGVDGNDVALALSEGPPTPLYHRGTEEHPEMIAPSGMMIGEAVISNSVSASEVAERDESSAIQDGNRDVMDTNRGMLMPNQLDDRPQDEETMDNLDFEEISDEELEEEARAGIGDALGVDWASLVAESRPRARADATPGSARRRWESHRILARLGVSARYAGWELMEELKSKYSNIKEQKEDTVNKDSTDAKLEQEVKQGIKQEDEQDVKSEEAAGGEEKENQRPKTAEECAHKEESKPLTFLHPVAMIHVAMRERQERRKALFASSGPYKRALSARRDLAIRRQLCNLPVKETAGDSQQTGPDVELYRLGIQLFERSV